MKLKFYAREDQLVREAGIAPRIGQAARYYGRTFVPPSDGQPATNPATPEPFEVEQGTEDGDKCARACRKGSLFAANKETAAALGVAFIDTAFANGEHTVKRAKAAAPDDKPASKKAAS